MEPNWLLRTDKTQTDLASTTQHGGNHYHQSENKRKKEKKKKGRRKKKRKGKIKQPKPTSLCQKGSNPHRHPMLVVNLTRWNEC